MNRSSWMLALGMLALAGCGRLDFDAEEGADEMDLMESEAALTGDQLTADDSMTVAGSECTALTPEQLAQRAADKAPQRFQPSTCVTATVAGATVSYTLNNCSGRYGWLQATGSFTATFSRPGAGGMQVQVAGTGLSVRGATMDVSATAVCTRVGNDRVFEVDSTVNATGPRGRTVKHVGDYTVTHEIGTQCIGVAGSWTNTSGLYQRVTTASGMEKCAGGCPAAGGSIVVETARGATTTINFDGTAVASWSTSGGRTGTVNLRCGGSTP